jgi:CelD/BcsL family acetyltransferase involved in cellulose biosynthesis
MHDSDLRLSIYTTFDELRGVRDEWDRFVAAIGSDIYFTFDWLETWWTYYGRGRQLRVFIVSRDGQIVAALPFFIEYFYLGPLRVRVARLVGADFTMPVFSPAIDQRYEPGVMRLVLDDLLTGAKCDLVSLSPLSGTTGLPAAVESMCTVEEGIRMARNETISPHTVFTLPATFEAYIASLAKQTRSNFRRDKRNLAQFGDVVHREVRGPDAVERLGPFMALHQKQWRATNKLGHFGDWPDSAAFTHALVQKLAAKDHVSISELIVNGETISFEFGFTFGDRFFWRLSARTMEEKWSKAGIGRLALLNMLERLIERGFRLVEGGPGHYDYKVKHGATEYPLRRLVVTPDRLLSRVRAEAILAWSALLHIAYYRFWFLKIAPRAGWLQRPLWRGWIRTRL